VETVIQLDVDSATVTITDEQSVPVTLTGTTAIAENAAGVATLTASLSVTTGSYFSEQIYWVTGTDYVASRCDHISPCWWLTKTFNHPAADLIWKGN
jgi:hypothetical protein